MIRWRCLPAILAVMALAACAAPPPAPGPSVHFIGHYDMPPGADLAAVGMPGVPVGGISGIDRDAATGLFHLISDDRSQRGPARFLTARIDADLSGIHGVTVLSATPLRNGDGEVFAPSAPGHPAVDPESIRVDPATGGLFWTSEGDPATGGDPLLMLATTDGRSMPVALPPTWHFDPAGRTGPRPNMALEGLATMPDGSLMLALEAPLRQDGPAASPDQGGLTRISRLSRGGQVLAQLAYPLDPIPRRQSVQPVDNGISEIARLDDRRLLVLERAGLRRADGRYEFDVRLYLADLASGDDVAALPSLAERPDVRPVAKRLLFASTWLPGGLPPDNQEGMALFPDPATGRCLLLLMSDDNFDAGQRSRLLLFTIDDPIASEGPASCGGR